MEYITKEAERTGWCVSCTVHNAASADVCESFANARFAEGLPHCFDSENIIYVEDKNEV